MLLGLGFLGLSGFLYVGFLTVLRASSNQYLVWFLAVLLLQ